MVNQAQSGHWYLHLEIKLICPYLGLIIHTGWFVFADESIHTQYVTWAGTADACFECSAWTKARGAGLLEYSGAPVC